MENNLVTYELQPSAGRVITSLRDAGYDFNTAVADIVDNSIAANATEIRIFAKCNERNGDITIVICDNGCGMTKAEVHNALTYGSREREDIHSLGKFGLGLKTASTSQCRSVSVLSRKTASSAPYKLKLDIDHAQKTNKWEYIESAPSQVELRYLDTVAKDSSGTVVIWRKCDRVMSREYSEPGGRTQQNAFRKKIDELRFHLSLVFQRFLDPDDSRANDISIMVNGFPVQAWDPFCRDMRATNLIVAAKTRAKNPTNKRKYPVEAVGFVVPPRDELSASEEAAVFPRGISPDKLQGIFVYRENRLIHWGDWCKLAKTEFHFRLCRVELSFSADLDECFNVDFKKSRIGIESSIADWLYAEVVSKTRKEGEKRYRKGVVSESQREARALHSKANTSIAKKAAEERGYFVQPLKDGTSRISNARGRTFVEEKPVGSLKGESNVVPVRSLPDDLLWRPGIGKDDKGRMVTCVEVNVSHPFYQRAYKACDGNQNAVKALDYFVWSLANAEYMTKDENSLENYEDMRRAVSRSLRALAEDLPVD